MSRERMQGVLAVVAGTTRQCWGRLTGNPLDVLEGGRERLSGRMHIRLGSMHDEAARQLAHLKNRMSEPELRWNYVSQRTESILRKTDNAR